MTPVPLLVFWLGSAAEEPGPEAARFGLYIRQVLEVLRRPALRPAVGWPEGVSGLVPSRGGDAPVVDVGARLGRPAAGSDLVVVARTGGGPIAFPARAARVARVILEDIGAAPELPGVPAGGLLGSVREGPRMPAILLLDLEALLRPAERRALGRRPAGEAAA